MPIFSFLQCLRCEFSGRIFPYLFLIQNCLFFPEYEQVLFLSDILLHIYFIFLSLVLGLQSLSAPQTQVKTHKSCLKSFNDSLRHHASVEACIWTQGCSDFKFCDGVSKLVHRNLENSIKNGRNPSAQRTSRAVMWDMETNGTSQLPLCWEKICRNKEGVVLGQGGGRECDELILDYWESSSPLTYILVSWNSEMIWGYLYWLIGVFLKVKCISKQNFIVKTSDIL